MSSSSLYANSTTFSRVSSRFSAASTKTVSQTTVMTANASMSSTLSGSPIREILSSQTATISATTSMVTPQIMSSPSSTATTTSVPLTLASVYRSTSTTQTVSALPTQVVPSHTAQVSPSYESIVPTTPSQSSTTTQEEEDSGSKRGKLGVAVGAMCVGVAFLVTGVLVVAILSIVVHFRGQRGHIKISTPDRRSDSFRYTAQSY